MHLPTHELIFQPFIRSLLGCTSYASWQAFLNQINYTVCENYMEGYFFFFSSGNQSQWVYNLHHQAIGWELEWNNKKQYQKHDLPQFIGETSQPDCEGGLYENPKFPVLPCIIFVSTFLLCFLSKAAWQTKGSSDSQQGLGPKLWLENSSIISTPRNYLSIYIFILYEIRHGIIFKREELYNPPLPKKYSLSISLLLCSAAAWDCQQCPADDIWSV